MAAIGLLEDLLSDRRAVDQSELRGFSYFPAQKSVF
jgi:hypothetical protein